MKERLCLVRERSASSRCCGEQLTSSRGGGTGGGGGLGEMTKLALVIWISLI
jgi:hypothetical protein